MFLNKNKKVTTILLWSVLFTVLATLSFNFYVQKKRASRHLKPFAVVITTANAIEETTMEEEVLSESEEDTFFYETHAEEHVEDSTIEESIYATTETEVIEETNVMTEVEEEGYAYLEEYENIRMIRDQREAKIYSFLFILTFISAILVLVFQCLYLRRTEIKEKLESACFSVSLSFMFITYGIYQTPFMIYEGMPTIVSGLIFSLIGFFLFSFGLNGILSFFTIKEKKNQSLLFQVTGKMKYQKKITIPVIVFIISILLFFIFLILPMYLMPLYELIIPTMLFSSFFLIIAITSIFVFKGNIKLMEEEQKAAIERAKEDERMRVDLIQNVSHDLRTPLTSILGYSELLQKETLSEEGKEDLTRLTEKAGYMKDLVESLFELTKVSSGVLKSNTQEIDLTRLLNQTLFFYEENLEKKNLKVVKHYEEKPLLILSDGTFLNQILSNLLNNVMKYALANTRVHIFLTEKENGFEIRITNVASYEMNFDEKEILNRFERGDKERSTEGSGIGLAIAVTYAEAIDGKFHVEIDGDQFSAILDLPKK